MGHDQKLLREKLNDLRKVKEKLNDWEWHFIESLTRWEGDFTNYQAAVLRRKWNKHCQRI